jgi:hypothetical protein
MPLFEIGPTELIPFRRVQVGPELYEREVEELLWQNLDAFIGRSLFPVTRQANVGNGLIPDVVALDIEGRVHVIEVKRDVDRRQLAQCLEYAGWARDASLDEIAGLFHEGAEAFFAAWTEFTGTSSPRLIRRPPELVLVARDFDRRTESALSFLTENDLPVTILRVNVYEDHDRRRFIDVATDHEVELTVTATAPGSDVDTAPAATVRSDRARFEIEGRRIQVADLLDAGLLTAGEKLTWERPRVGKTYIGDITDTGSIRLHDGRAFSSPSRAAMEAADVTAYDGWYAWRTDAGRHLADLRAQLLAAMDAAQADDSTNHGDPGEANGLPPPAAADVGDD